MLNNSKVLSIITKNNLSAIIETAICTIVIFQFITLVLGVARYQKIDNLILCGSSNDNGSGLWMILNALGYF